MPSLFCKANKVSAPTSAKPSKPTTSASNYNNLMTTDLFFSLPRGGGCIAHPQPSKPRTKKTVSSRTAASTCSSPAAADLFAHIPGMQGVLSPPSPPQTLCRRPRRRSSETRPKASTKPAASTADLFAHVPALGCLLVRKEKRSSSPPSSTEKRESKQARLIPVQQASSAAADASSLFARVPGMGCFVLPEALRPTALLSSSKKLAREADTTSPPAYGAPAVLPDYKKAITLYS
ncbi:hypothetical protein HDU88_005662 [Geranomyces variabilis]|nr:hypothetical protein HDU88_005662 [Geranomyces variabilis]